MTNRNLSETILLIAQQYFYEYYCCELYEWTYDGTYYRDTLPPEEAIPHTLIDRECLIIESTDLDYEKSDDKETFVVKIVAAIKTTISEWSLFGGDSEKQTYTKTEAVFIELNKEGTYYLVHLYGDGNMIEEMG